MVEMIMLEQFTQILPTKVKEWVKHHWPSTLAETMILIENYVSTEGPASLMPRAGTPGNKTLTPNGGRARREDQGQLNWLLPFGVPPDAGSILTTKVEWGWDRGP